MQGTVQFDTVVGGVQRQAIARRDTSDIGNVPDDVRGLSQNVGHFGGHHGFVTRSKTCNGDPTCHSTASGRRPWPCTRTIAKYGQSSSSVSASLTMRWSGIVPFSTSHASSRRPAAARARFTTGKLRPVFITTNASARFMSWMWAKGVGGLHALFQCGAVLGSIAFGHRGFHVHAIKAGFGAENTRGFYLVRVHVGGFFAFRKGECACFKELREAGKTSRNRPEMRRVTSMRGRLMSVNGRTSKPLTRSLPASHLGEEAREVQCHGHFFARGAHGGGTPEINNETFRIVAFVLQVAADQFFGEFDALGMGRAGWNAARIDGIKVAARGQHIGAATVRGAGGTGRDEFPVESGKQAVCFTCPKAKGMQPVAILGFLDVADETVDAGDRFGHAGVVGYPEVVLDTGGAGLVADRIDQAVAAGGIKAISGGIFVEQAFELQGGHQALRWIDDGQVGGEGFGPAVVRQCDRFSGQPFEVRLGKRGNRGRRGAKFRLRRALKMQLQGDGDKGCVAQCAARADGDDALVRVIVACGGYAARASCARAAWAATAPPASQRCERRRRVETGSVEYGADCGGVDVIMFGDDNKVTLTGVCPPRAIELLAHTGTDGLDQQTHGFSSDSDIAFDPQDVLFVGQLFNERPMRSSPPLKSWPTNSTSCGSKAMSLHGLEDSETPYDPGQTPADLVVLSFSDSDLGAFAAGWHRGGGRTENCPPYACAILPPCASASMAASSLGCQFQSAREARPAPPIFPLLAPRQRPAHQSRCGPHRRWHRLASTPTADKKLALVLSTYPGREDQIAMPLVSSPRLNRRHADDVGKRWLHRTSRRFRKIPPKHHNRVADECIRRGAPPSPKPSHEDLKTAWPDPTKDPLYANGAFHFPAQTCATPLSPCNPNAARLTSAKPTTTTSPVSRATPSCFLSLAPVARLHALIHIGAHGTLEWLPGKSVALSDDCWPEALTADLPVIYPFIVNDPVKPLKPNAASTAPRLMASCNSNACSTNIPPLMALIPPARPPDRYDPRRGPRRRCRGRPRDNRRHLHGRSDHPHRPFRLRLKESQYGDGLHTFALGQVKQTACLRSRREIRHARSSGSPTVAAPMCCPRPQPLCRRSAQRSNPRGPCPRRQTPEELIRRHLQDEGDYPKGLVVDLWGSATMRTAGEEVAMALHLAGLSPNGTQGANASARFEVLPRRTRPCGTRRSRRHEPLQGKNPACFRPQTRPLWHEHGSAMLDYSDEAARGGRGMAESLRMVDRRQRRRFPKPRRIGKAHAIRRHFCPIQDLTESDVLLASTTPATRAGSPRHGHLGASKPAMYHVDTTKLGTQRPAPWPRKSPASSAPAPPIPTGPAA
ncbi:Aerobic cobaltochelatase subunit CobN [Nymphon striatum]|nr:Aerobic cobaltochelatase subunit CobN [Nymphon striatum]